MATKTALTIGEQIDRNKDGRSQKWIVQKMNDTMQEMNPDYSLTEVQFSNKKNGWDSFTELELTALSEILDAEIG